VEPLRCRSSRRYLPVRNASSGRRVDGVAVDANIFRTGRRRRRGRGAALRRRGDRRARRRANAAVDQASAKIKARLDHVEKELVRLTSVLAIDVDAGTETRIPRPTRSSEAPGGGGLKALKAATDATAGALVQVKRERDEAQDRNECIVCMERPRAVLFEPCRHLLVCTTCAAADACPYCAIAVEERITVANLS
jgi:hypothetical protein